MIRAVVPGAAGRMGGRVIYNINTTEGIKLTGATEVSGSSAIGRDAGEVAGIEKNGVLIKDNIKDALIDGDIIIDFTSPEATIQNLKVAVEAGKGMVIGTTGLSKEQIEEVKRASKNIKIVYAPNMSVGVNVMLKILADAAKILGDDYDVEIIETHHRFKKDAPSGTAVKIAQVLADALGRDLEKEAVYVRNGMIGERRRKEIGIQTLRAGDTVGDHTVIFGGLGERLEFTHQATNRDNFARGAVRAALWLGNKGPGLFDMQNVLGLHK